MKKYSLLIFMLVLMGCGYTPIAHHTKEAFGDRVFVEVKIDVRDPKNSVTLKDEVSKAIFKKLHTPIGDKEDSIAVIEIILKNISFSPLAENTIGFSTFYQCQTEIEFKYTNKVTQKTRVFTKQGYYNFALGDVSVITDSIRMEAINKAVLNTLDNFISQIGIDIS
ncbi:hypothetical protein [Helicobacter mesocricetorum]|uniref:hypothetical protein n=1 Tax=Helicobacter mesocricetorum TaxID=87012 RepID=UPI000CF108FE|nr:hypothetical protein [Helicobacter mesocricetorum]